MIDSNREPAPMPRNTSATWLLTSSVRERTARQVEDTATEHGQDQRDDLVLGPRGEPQTDAEIRRAEQRSRHVAGENGAPVQVAQHRDRNRQWQREQQRD